MNVSIFIRIALIHCYLAVLSMTAQATEDEPPRRMTDIQDLAWSPDGKEIVFVTDRNLEQPGLYLWRVGINGKDLKQITFQSEQKEKGKPIQYSDSYPQWSPDGKQILFTSTRGETRRDDPTRRLNQVFMCDRDGKNIQQVTSSQGWLHNFRASWFPDGKRIAFVTGRNQGADILVGNLQKKEERYLAFNIRLIEDYPSISYDGKNIVFVTEKQHWIDESKNEVNICIRSTSKDEKPQDVKERVLVKTGMTAIWDVQAICSPVAPVFAFTKRYPQNDLWIMNLDGTGLRQVYDSFKSKVSLDYGSRFAWSPDGKRIAFVSKSKRKLPPDVREDGIWICDVATGTVKEVTLPPVIEKKGVTP